VAPCNLQVTLALGILTDLQGRRCVANADEALPHRVIFIFSASQRNQLALLRRPLIAHAL
jgi:hypothetical protein